MNGSDPPLTDTLESLRRERDEARADRAWLRAQIEHQLSIPNDQIRERLRAVMALVEELRAELREAGILR